MSGTWETKKKIIEILSKGNKTMSDISRMLNLAPSTVSQHIQELVDAGAVEQVPNEYIKKWKYYRLKPNVQVEEVMDIARRRRAEYGKYVFTAVAVIAVFLAGLFAYFEYFAAAYETVPISMTDPIMVPNGTTAVNMSYSSLDIYALHNGRSGWINTSINGSVNLMSLQNVSQLIGKVTMPQNSTVTKVRFNISSAKITVNGNTYGLILPIKSLTLDILPSKVNNTAGILIDLSPVVLNMSGIAPNAIVMNVVGKAGMIYMPNSTERMKIIRMPLHSLLPAPAFRIAKIRWLNQNISVKSVALSTSGDNTSFEIAVKNNGNSSIRIYSVVLRGNEFVENGAVRNVPGFIPLIVTGSGELRPPFSVNDMNSMGYNISPGATAVLSFYGTIVGRNGTIETLDRNASYGVTVVAGCGMGMSTVGPGAATNGTSIINASSSNNATLSNTRVFYPSQIINYYGHNPVIKLNQSFFDCDTSASCVPVYVTPCRNGAPMQEICINSAYVPIAESWWSHPPRPIICPMYIMLSKVSCACSSGSCVTIYNSPVVGNP